MVETTQEQSPSQVVEVKKDFKMPETPEEMLEAAKSLKDEGNAFFKIKDYKKALAKYSKV